MHASRRIPKYCAVYECKNNSEDKMVSFYTLPRKIGSKQWLEVIRKDDIPKRDLKLRSYSVCSTHFAESSSVAKLHFTSEDYARRHESQSVENQRLGSESPDCSETVVKQEGEPEERNNLTDLNVWRKKILKMKEEERKDLALNLYFANPHTYKLLQTLFELPKVETLYKSYSRIPLKLDNRVITSLFLRMQSLPDQAKYCTMCLGQMKMKPHLYYDTKEDDLIGFHFIDGRVTNKIATRAYVIMLQGIFYNWSQPVSYAFMPDLDSYSDLGPWVDKTIKTLQEFGIEVKAVVTDQDSNFDKFAKEVKEVTIEKPYFFVGERKVFYIFNVPRLLCSVRDGLVASDFEYGESNISWRYIKMLYDEEKTGGFKLIPKITAVHVDPETFSFQTPRVELAAQVFSRSIATAMEIYIAIGVLPEEARATATFLQSMDNIFDVLNSSATRSDTPLQYPFKDLEEQRHVLTQALTIFSEIRPLKPEQRFTITETLKNFQISIKAIWQMYQDLTDLLFEKLYTRRLNKDNLEVFFGSVLWKESSGTDPTPVKFSRAFSKLFLSGMQRKTRCNCPDLLSNACNVLSLALDETKREPPTRSLVILHPSMNDYQIDLPDNNALTYVSAYLLHKCFKVHNCEHLKQVMKFMRYLSAGRFKYKDINRKKAFHAELKFPPIEFQEYVGRLETAFVTNCVLLISEQPGSTIYKLVQDVPKTLLCGCFPVEYCVKLFVRLRIYTTLKFNQKAIKNGSSVIGVEHL